MKYVVDICLNNIIIELLCILHAYCSDYLVKGDFLVFGN